MQAYIISLAVGLLVGCIYGLMGVRSPAPPAIALVGLLGILLGEQIVPIVKHLISGHSVLAFLQTGGRTHVLGNLPANTPKKDA